MEEVKQVAEMLYVLALLLLIWSFYWIIKRSWGSASHRRDRREEDVQDSPSPSRGTRRSAHAEEDTPPTLVDLGRGERLPKKKATPKRSSTRTKSSIRSQSKTRKKSDTSKTRTRTKPKKASPIVDDNGTPQANDAHQLPKALIEIVPIPLNELTEVPPDKHRDESAQLPTSITGGPDVVDGSKTPTIGIKENDQAAFLDAHGINEFFHMTHRSNLHQVMSAGLLSHKAAHENGFLSKDISDDAVQKIRRTKQDPVHQRRLHEYVPLYVNPKNAMLYVRKSIQDEIVILSISRDILRNHEFVFTDGNAASGPTRFFADLSSLVHLDWECLNGPSWHDRPDGKRTRCAEFLVFPTVEVENIMRVYCRSDRVRASLLSVETGLHPDLFVVRGDLFFPDSPEILSV